MSERLQVSKEIYPKTPVLEGDDLEVACADQIPGSEIDKISKIQYSSPENFINAIHRLSSLNLDIYLPIGDPTSEIYQKNLRGCKELQKQARALSVLLRKHDLYSEKGQFNCGGAEEAFRSYPELVKQTRTLLASDARKAAWLERSYYPVVFGKTLSVARAEVRQFLIKHQNLRDIGSLEDPQDALIEMRAPVSYILNGGFLDSAAHYSGKENRISIRMPNGAAPRDEWETYHSAVHELVHYISQRGCQWGQQVRDQTRREFSLPQLNEGLTETITYFIAKDHILKGKTELFRQEMPDLQHFAYTHYTIPLAQVFSQIPLDDFIEALVTEEGLEKLVKKFEEVFGHQDAFASYSQALSSKLPAPEKIEDSNGPVA